MIKGIIYGLDDTMVNSDPLHARAWEILLSEYGHKFSELPENIRSSFIGMRIIDILQEILNYLKLDVDINTFYRKRTEVFLELVKNELELLPGLVESLQRFKSNNYKLAIASSGAKQYINLVIDRFSIKDYFDVIITGDDVKIGKPNPETYLVAAKKLNLATSECIVFEDATKGIQAANAAGCKCIAIINPNIPPQNVKLADTVVNSFNEISIDMIHRQ